eukprot:13200128-Alexandrium_andersonii.AAC.1
MAANTHAERTHGMQCTWCDPAGAWRGHDYIVMLQSLGRNGLSATVALELDPAPTNDDPVPLVRTCRV